MVLKENIAKAEKCGGKITYEFHNGDELNARYNRDKKLWSMNCYAANDMNFPLWDKDKLFESFEDIVKFIVECELDHIKAYTEHLKKFGYNVVAETVPNFVQDAVEANIKFWH